MAPSTRQSFQESIDVGNIHGTFHRIRRYKIALSRIENTERVKCYS